MKPTILDYHQPKTKKMINQQYQKSLSFKRFTHGDSYTPPYPSSPTPPPSLPLSKHLSLLRSPLFHCLSTSHLLLSLVSFQLHSHSPHLLVFFLFIPFVHLILLLCSPHLHPTCPYNHCNGQNQPPQHHPHLLV